MRELEFLPDWYNRLQRRRRAAFLQTWLTLAVAGGVGLWLFSSQRAYHASASELASLQGQVLQSAAQLEQMDRLEALQRQMRKQADLYNRLGAHVESARLLGQLAEVMPETVSLLSLEVETEETPVQLSGPARAALKDPAQPPVERRLKIKIQGVAPTDVELATFLTELNKVPFFEQVAPTYVKDKHEARHVLRQFEICFTVNLGEGARS